MKITKVTLYKVDIPMITTFTLSYGTLTERPTVIVKLETSEGIVSYAEAASLSVPYYNHETVDTCMLML